MRLEALFIDSAGVLVDLSNGLLGNVWHRRVGEFCVPRLGGAAAQWERANVEAAQKYGKRYTAAARADGGRGARVFRAKADRLWTVDMCSIVGVPAPRDALAFADECVQYVTAGAAAAAFPDAASGVRALAARVSRLFTATSQDSRQIDGYARALGIRELFEQTYGGDLVNHFKVNAAFFTAIMADAGVAPERAAMVDDNPEYLNWARESGMKTYLLERRGGDPEGHELVPSLTALAERL